MEIVNRRRDYRNHERNPERNREKGSILMLGAGTIFVVMAFAGLALDASYMYFHKRAMQTAADAGAYGGALELLRGNTDVTTVAKNDTALNGFTDGTDSVVVTVNNPPASGTKSGDSNFVEVIISHPQPTWFMRALDFNSVTVAARAVAGLGTTGNGCVYALNQDTSKTNNGFFANGTTNSNFSCGVFSNSNFRSVGGACVVTPTVSYTGTYSNSNSSGNCGPQGIGKGVAIVDPLRKKYSVPSYTACQGGGGGTKITTGLTVTLSPGTYCGGISITGSVQNVIFSPGEYILVGGGLSINGGVNVSGSGVTFFNTYDQSNKYGAISITGSGTVDFTAPTSGTDKGLLFYQDPTVAWSASNDSIIAGGANSVYDGIIYFPTTDLKYAGNSSTTSGGTDGYTMLIGYDITINGTAQINTDFSALGGTNPLQNALFVE
ncbi:MAG TPA: pilus assembly protein TadG-related protein [Bryobacteraceae bacterium]|nr:pilus assembly protein TadG-related protein [Bryobacteraceae bacterium]